MSAAPPLVMPADPVPVVLDWLPRAIAAAPALAGFRYGATIPDRDRPPRFLRVDQVGMTELARSGSAEHDIRVQIWHEQGRQQRMAAAVQLLAWARADLHARRESGPITMPDPADPSVELEQLIVGIIMKGTQQ